MSERPIHFRGGVQEQADGTFIALVHVTNLATKEEAVNIAHAIRRPIAKAVMALYPGARTEGMLDS